MRNGIQSQSNLVRQQATTNVQPRNAQMFRGFAPAGVNGSFVRSSRVVGQGAQWFGAVGSHDPRSAVAVPMSSLSPQARPAPSGFPDPAPSSSPSSLSSFSSSSSSSSALESGLGTASRRRPNEPLPWSREALNAERLRQYGATRYQAGMAIRRFPW
jgi:hypothetical protein